MQNTRQNVEIEAGCNTSLKNTYSLDCYSFRNVYNVDDYSVHPTLVSISIENSTSIYLRRIIVTRCIFAAVDTQTMIALYTNAVDASLMILFVMFNVNVFTISRFCTISPFRSISRKLPFHRDEFLRLNSKRKFTQKKMKQRVTTHGVLLSTKFPAKRHARVAGYSLKKAK